MTDVSWIVLAGVALVSTLCFLGAFALWRKERRIRRVQLPARLLTKMLLPPGFLLTVEYPGPDGAPRQASLMSAIRRGLGATPEFQGWVWVNANDPSDVVVRPGARQFWPLMLTIVGSVVLLFGLMAVAILSLDAAMSSLPTAP